MPVCWSPARSMVECSETGVVANAACPAAESAARIAACDAETSVDPAIGLALLGAIVTVPPLPIERLFSTIWLAVRFPPPSTTRSPPALLIPPATVRLPTPDTSSI